MSTTCRRPAKARRANPTPGTPARPIPISTRRSRTAACPCSARPKACRSASSNPPKVDPAPMQVTRRHPVHPSTMAMNRAYWALPGIKGTVWEHYMLVASQWPTVPMPVGPQNDGTLFPRPDARTRTRRAKTISPTIRPARTRRTSPTRRWRPICRTRRQAAWPATPASPTRAGAISPASFLRCIDRVRTTSRG